MDILKHKSPVISGENKFKFYMKTIMQKELKKPILLVVNNSEEFFCLVDINTGDEIVGDPSKYEKDTYSLA